MKHEKCFPSLWVKGGCLHDHAPSFMNSSLRRDCKLLKSSYSLINASREWYKRLSTLHLSLAFNQAHSDHSMLTNITTYSYTTLLIYVADIVQVEDHLSKLSRIKSILDNNFGIKYLGILKFFLGLDVAHSPKGIFLCQIQHCLTCFLSWASLAANWFQLLWYLVFICTTMMGPFSMTLISHSLNDH